QLILLVPFRACMRSPLAKTISIACHGARISISGLHPTRRVTGARGCAYLRSLSTSSPSRTSRVTKWSAAAGRWGRNVSDQRERLHHETEPSISNWFPDEATVVVLMVAAPERLRARSRYRREIDMTVRPVVKDTTSHKCTTFATSVQGRARALHADHRQP